MNPSRPSLSLCMIVRNEAHNLPRSLMPVCREFDEIIVVDTGSNDDTPNLARRLGARVLKIQWPEDFGAARNVSLRAATGDWIMWLDGDNSVSPESIQLIRDSIATERDCILWCTEVVVPEGERLLQKRVFPRSPEVYFSGKVHEQLVHPARFRSLVTRVEIIHWGYADKAAAKEKGERNLHLLREMAEEQTDQFYVQYQMGRTLMNLRRFDEALDWLDRARVQTIEASGNVALWRHACLLTAQVQARLGQDRAAEESLTRLLQLAPRYGPGHFHLARLFYFQGDYRRAESHFHSFLGLGVDDLWTGFNAVEMKCLANMFMGRCLEKMDRREEARGAYFEALKMNPEQSEACLALARLAWSDGRKDEAQDLLGRCLNRSPRDRRANELLKEINGNV